MFNETIQLTANLPLLTDFTFNGFSGAVQSFVTSEIAGLPKGFSAKIASERSFVRVRSHVNF